MSNMLHWCKAKCLLKALTNIYFVVTSILTQFNTLLIKLLSIIETKISMISLSYIQLIFLQIPNFKIMTA